LTGAAIRAFVLNKACVLNKSLFVEQEFGPCVDRQGMTRRADCGTPRGLVSAKEGLCNSA
jgi:hypothetical protein